MLKNCLFGATNALRNWEGGCYFIGPGLGAAVFVHIGAEYGAMACGVLTGIDAISIAALLSSLALFFFNKKRPLASQSVLLGWTGAFLVCLALFVLLLPFFGATIAGLFLAGTGLCFMATSWFTYYARLDMATATHSLLFAFTVVSVSSWLLHGMASEKQLFVLMGMLVLSAGLCTAALHKSEKTAWRSAVESKVRFSWILMVAVAVFTGVYVSLTKSQSLLVLYPNFNSWVLLGILALVLVVTFLSEQASLSVFLLVAAPLCLVGMMLYLFVDLDHAVSIEVISLGFILFYLYALIILRGLVFFGVVDAYYASSLFVAFLALGFLLGRVLQVLLTLACGLQVQDLSLEIAIGVVLLVMVFTSLCLSNRNLHICSRRVFRPTPLEDAATHEELLSRMLVPWIEEYRLQNREIEVLSLLLQDMTAGEIAEKLYIAQGTVKSHISRIYSKLGIHSKAELLERFEQLKKTQPL